MSFLDTVKQGHVLAGDGMFELPTANEVINKLSVSIDGAGGGQDFLATAGGKNIKGIDKVIRDGRTYFNSVINN